MSCQYGGTIRQNQSGSEECGHMAIRRNKRTNTANSKAARDRQNKKVQAADAKKARKEAFQKVVVVVFAVLMALSILLPSLASIFGRSQDQGQTIENMADIDEMYQPIVQGLEDELKGDEKNAQKLSDLARYYLEWASYASYFSTTEDDTAHVLDLYDQALAYMDRALEIEDEPSMHVDRIMAQFYRDSTAGEDDPVGTAIAALEPYLQEGGAEYAPGWLRLGSLYTYAGYNEKAEAAFTKAAELDPDDELGVKTSAEEQIAALHGETTESTVPSGSGAGDLQGTLSDATGTTI